MVLDHRPPAESIQYCIGRALDYEHPEAIRLFLEYGADPNYRVCWKGHRTQAHKAVVAGRSTRVIGVLLDHGADPNAQDEFGMTLYRSAVRLGQDETAALLASRGADPYAATDDDRAMGEMMNGRKPARRPEHVDGELLAEASLRNDVRAIELLVDAGADVNTNHGMSPLHWACWQGNFDAARALLDRGADMTARNKYGGNALCTAVYGSAYCFDEGGGGMRIPEETPPRGYARIVEMLIERGAKPPEQMPQCGDAVREVLRRHGVPDEDDQTP
jgi:hypothetical protein